MFGIRGRNPEVCIRQASEEDLKRIVEIGQRAFPYIVDPARFFSERIRRFWVFVAEVEGNVVGFVDMEIKGEEAQIAGIAVDEQFRGMGIGDRLLSFALDFLRRLGIRQVTLYTKDSNERAVTLYAKHGFRRAEHVKGDIYVWRRTL